MRALLRLFVGVLCLHLLTATTYPSPDWASALCLVNFDLILIFSFTALLALGGARRRLVIVAVTLLVLWVAVLRIGFAVAHEFLDRDLVLHDDIHLLDGLIVYVTDNLRLARGWFVVSVVVLGFAGLFASVYALVRVVLREFERPVPTAVVVVLGQIAILAFWLLGSAGVPDGIVLRSMLMETARQGTRVFEGQPWRYIDLLEEGNRRLELELDGVDRGLSGLEKADVYVVFVESYGRALFRNGGLRAAFEKDVPHWERELSKSGFSAVSRFLTSPVVGAESHVAHAELLAGIPVATHGQASVLLEMDHKSMPGYFRDAGYLTINVHPKMDRSLPSTEYFGFEKEFFGRDTDYARVASPYDLYHWAHGPDQYYLAQLLERYVRKSQQPVFAMFVSATSHAPFSRLPPYLKDWKRALNPKNLAPRIRRDLGFVGYKSDTESIPAYGDTIRYSIECVVGFAQQLERPALILVMGDHQPPLLIEERRGYEVPVHVLANRPGLLEPFLREGFTAGMNPPESPDGEGERMHRILPLLLRDFAK